MSRRPARTLPITILLILSAWMPGIQAWCGEAYGGVDEQVGQATYSIPILLPPGTAGTGPALGLEYRSGTGKGPAGWVGLGWKMAGIGAIERSTRQGVPLDYPAGPACSGAYCYLDEFSLDGTDLVCDDPDCSGRYRTRVDDGTRIHYAGPMQGWEIQDREGRRYLYGHSPAARIENPASGQVFSWLLERVIDVHGNWIEIGYEHGLGVAYPSVIEYAQAGRPANRRVVFLTEPRPDRAIDYRGGLRREVDRRLLRIEVRAADDAPVTSYALGYHQSEGSGRSLLASVQRFGTDGATALPPYVFEYSAREVRSHAAGPDCTPFETGSTGEVTDGFSEESVNFAGSYAYGPHWLGGDGTNDVARYPIDLNRDGLVDLYLGSHFSRPWMAPGNGENFGAPIPWSGNPGNADTYFASTQSIGDFRNAHVWLGAMTLDIDGDGRPDHLDIDGSGLWAWPTRFGSETGLYGSQGWLMGGASSRVHLGRFYREWHLPIQAQLSEVDMPGYGAGVETLSQLLDMNGDGRLDSVIACVGTCEYEDGAHPEVSHTWDWSVWLNEGRSADGSAVSFSTSPIRWWDERGPIRSSLGSTLTIDFNGDGLPDRLISSTWIHDSGPPRGQRWTVYYNNGAGFDPGEEFAFYDLPEDAPSRVEAVHAPYGVQTHADVFDLNGDGFPDHVFTGYLDRMTSSPFLEGPGNFWRVRRGTGSGFADAVLWSGPAESDSCMWNTDWDLIREHFQAANMDLSDFDGDGLLDRWLGHDGDIRLNTGPVIDLLTRARQPLGAVRTWEYDSSSRMRDDDGQPASPGLGIPLPVVVATVIRDGREGSPDIVTSYHYGLGEFDYSLREFRGFGRVARTEHQSDAQGAPADLVITSTYRTDIACAGRLRTRERSSGDVVYSRDERLQTPFARPEASENPPDLWHACITTYAFSESIEGGEGTPATTMISYDYGPDPIAAHYNVKTILEAGDVERMPWGAGSFWRDLDPTDNRITLLEYALPTDASSAIVSRLSRRTVVASTQRPPELEHGALDIRYLYDGLPPGQVGAGLLTREERWQTYPLADPPREGEWIPTAAHDYDAYGNPQTRTGPPTEDDPDGYQSATIYDPTYATFPIAFIAGSDVVEGATARTLEYAGCPPGHEPPPGLGLPCVDTDPAGVRTVRGYDSLGREDLVEYAGGLLETRSYEIALELEPAESRITTTRDLGDGAPLISVNWLDGLGRSFLEDTPGASGQTISVTSRYDERGRLAWRSLPHLNTDPADDGLETRHLYDPLGRERRRVDPDGETVRVWTYGVREVVEDVYSGTTAPESRLSRSVRGVDALGRLVRVEGYEDAVSAARPFALKAEYTLTDQLRRVHDPIQNDPDLCEDYEMGPACPSQRHTTHLVYDGLGRRVRLSDPDTGTWKFHYDAAGLLEKRVDGAGRTQEFEYDELQRRIEQRFTPSGLGTSDAEFEYQSDPALPGYGRLAAVHAPNSASYALSYDAAGRLIRRSQETGGYVFVEEFTHDALGRITGHTFPDGEVFTREYDGTRLVAIRGADLDILTGAEYDALGRPQVLELGGSADGPAATLEREYDPATARLQRMRVTGRHQEAQPNLDLGLEFDGLGQLVEQSGSLGDAPLLPRSFRYDGLGRLVSATGPWEVDRGNPDAATWTYRYDALGNLRRQESPTATPEHRFERTWEYDDPAMPRFLTRFTSSDRTDAMTPEPGGNPATINGAALIWNAQNRLYQGPGAMTAAVYDAVGRRAVYLPNGFETVVVRVGFDFEVDLALHQSTKFFFVAGERIATRAVAGYTPYTAWTLSWPHRWIVGPLARVAAPVGGLLYLLGVIGLAAVGLRGAAPGRATSRRVVTDWVAAPGVLLLCVGLAVYPSHPALAQSGGGAATWHGGHTYGLLIYGNDHLGSARVIIDAEGTTVETRDFAAFGARFAHGGGLALKHLFTGQPYDDTTGLSDYGSRMYRADWGRFLSPDERVEAFDSEGLNPFSYARNSPQSRVDPAGTDSITATPSGRIAIRHTTASGASKAKQQLQKTAASLYVSAAAGGVGVAALGIAAVAIPVAAPVLLATAAGLALGVAVAILAASLLERQALSLPEPTDIVILIGPGINHPPPHGPVSPGLQGPNSQGGSASPGGGTRELEIRVEDEGEDPEAGDGLGGGALGPGPSRAVSRGPGSGHPSGVPSFAPPGIAVFPWFPGFPF